MGTSIAVESIRIQAASNVQVSGVTLNNNYQSVQGLPTSYTIALTLNNPTDTYDLKFYYDKTDSTKVYSDSFQVSLTPNTDTAGNQYDGLKRSIILNISATVTGKDASGTPVIGNYKLINHGWSDTFQCTNCNPVSLVCKALVGTSTVLTPSNPTNNPIVPLKLQFKPSNGTSYLTSNVNILYEQYGDLTSSSFVLPPVNASYTPLPKVILTLPSQ